MYVSLSLHCETFNTKFRGQRTCYKCFSWVGRSVSAASCQLERWTPKGTDWARRRIRMVARHVLYIISTALWEQDWQLLTKFSRDMYASVFSGPSALWRRVVCVERQWWGVCDYCDGCPSCRLPPPPPPTEPHPVRTWGAAFDAGHWSWHEEWSLQDGKSASCMLWKISQLFADSRHSVWRCATFWCRTTAGNSHCKPLQPCFQRAVK